MIEEPGPLAGLGFREGVIVALSAGVTQALNWATSWRRAKADSSSIEVSSALSVTAKWKELYDEQKARAERLQIRCDELQERLDALDEKFSEERREMRETLTRLSARIAHCEMHHKENDKAKEV